MTSILDAAESPEEAKYFATGGEALPEPEAPVEEAEAPVDEPAKDEPAAEVKTEAKVEPEKKEERAEDKTVPIAALHESRQQTKELRETLAKERDERVKLAQIVESLRKKQEDAGKPETKTPDPDEDPVGFLKWQAAEANKTAADAVERSKKVEADHQASTQRQDFERRVRADEARFQAQTADYGSAVNYAVAALHKIHETLGTPDEERIAAVQGQIQDIANAAFAHNRSPAEALYGLAKIWGYSGEKVEPKLAEVPKQTAAEKVGQINKAQAEAGSRMAAGGNESDNWTLDRLSKMDPDDPEFDKGWALYAQGKLR